MRRLPLRVTLRIMMMVVGAVALLLWLILRDWDLGRALGVGHTKIPIVFIVTDRDSGQPIEGAAIRLQDLDWVHNPDPPYVLDLKTGQDGSATVFEAWQFTVSTGLPSGRIQHYHVAYPHWEMQFSSEGYQAARASFADIERKDRRFHGSAPPPPIRVRLRRQSEANRSHRARAR